MDVVVGQDGCAARRCPCLFMHCRVFACAGLCSYSSFFRYFLFVLFFVYIFLVTVCCFVMCEHVCACVNVCLRVNVMGANVIVNTVYLCACFFLSNACVYA